MIRQRAPGQPLHAHHDETDFRQRIMRLILRSHSDKPDWFHNKLYASELVHGQRGVCSKYYYMCFCKSFCFSQPAMRIRLFHAFEIVENVFLESVN